MNFVALTAFALTLSTSSALATDSMISVPSAYSTSTTMDRLEAAITAHKLKIFARIDHAGGAHSIGLELRPTELLIFGHPKGGTPLMQCAQVYGVELPLHALAWEDAGGKSWIGYRPLTRLDSAPVDAACDAAMQRLTAVLDALVREASRD